MPRYYGVNRYVCEVLDEIRKCHETRNYAILLSLIEEVQTMVNRMEAGLSDASDLKKLAEDRSELKAEVRDLEKQIKELKKQKRELCPEDISEND